MQTATYDITITVQVTDPQALYQAAKQRYADENGCGSVDDADDYLKEGDDINVEACLQMLADPGASWDGAQIMNSGAELIDSEDM